MGHRITMVQSPPAHAQAWFAPLHQDIIYPINRQPRHAFPEGVRQPHPAPIFRTSQCATTHVILPRRLQFHAEHSAVFRTLLANRPRTQPESSPWDLPTNYLLRRAVRTLARPRYSQGCGRFSGRNRGRPDTHSTLYPTTTGKAEIVILREGRHFEGHDRPLWGD